MKKTIAFFIVGILLISAVFATSISPVILPPKQAPFENNQQYAVLFDEEGEATVIAKITVQNFDTQPIEQLALEMPGKVQIIYAVQKIVPENELKSEHSYQWNKETYDDFTYSILSPQQQNTGNSALVTLPLAKKIQQQEQLSLLIYYKVTGFVKEELGLFAFSFETPKIASHTTSVHVSINVASDLSLKDAKARTQYVDNTLFAQAQTMSFSKALMSMQNNYYLWNQGITKYVTALDPYENVLVTGTYARSWFRLYWFQTVISVLVSIFILLMLLVSIRSAGKEGNERKDQWITSFLSALIVILIFIFGMWAAQATRSIGPVPLQAIARNLDVLIGFTMFISILATLVLPSVYIGKKQHSALAGIKTALLTVGWIVLLTIILLLFFKSIGVFF